MTPDPIEAICEEMERETTHSSARLWAARLRAWWSPERREFLATSQHWWQIIREMIEAEHLREPWATAISRMDDAYHALKESEKV